MKKLFKLFAIGLLASATFTACDKDDCKDVVCGDYGQCIDGSCLCNEGYEQGSDGLCSVEVRQKFLGSFTGTESCSSSPTGTYTITVIRGTGIRDIQISNFWNLFDNAVLATISGNEVTIGRQDPDGDGYVVEGSGSISGTTLTLTYTVTSSTGSMDYCNSSVFYRN